MRYTIHLEYSRYNHKSHISRHGNKNSLRTSFFELAADSEVYLRADAVVFTVDGKPVIKIKTSVPANEAWDSFNALTNPVGRRSKVRNSVRMIVWLPAEVVPILKERGNGSTSAGIVNVLGKANDDEITPLLGL